MGAQNDVPEPFENSRDYRVEIRYPFDKQQNQMIDITGSPDLIKLQRYFLDHFLPSRIISKQTHLSEIHCLNGHRSANWGIDDWILQYIICSRQDDTIQHEIYCNVYYSMEIKPERNCACVIC